MKGLRQTPSVRTPPNERTLSNGNRQSVSSDSSKQSQLQFKYVQGSKQFYSGSDRSTPISKPRLHSGRSKRGLLTPVSTNKDLGTFIATITSPSEKYGNYAVKKDKKSKNEFRIKTNSLDDISSVMS
jgi:hypothetical protein